MDNTERGGQTDNQEIRQCLRWEILLYRWTVQYNNNSYAILSFIYCESERYVYLLINRIIERL